MTDYKLNLIFNRNTQGIIGINNGLLCWTRGDFLHFKEQTMNKIVVMGYNTFLSLPGDKPIVTLKDRLNVVITNNHYNELVNKISTSEESLDILVYKSFNDFYQNLIRTTISEPRFEKYLNVKDVFVIGGSFLYNYVYDNFTVNAIYETITNISISINDYIKEGNKIIYFTKDIDQSKYQNIYTKEYSGEMDLNGGNKRENKKINGDYTINIYQNKETVNTQELEYLNLIRYIYNNGKCKDSRNSKVISVFSPPQMRFDLRKGFPLLTTKRVAWKTVLRELLWFISGSTDNKLLQWKNVHIWDGNSTREYLSSRGLNEYREGDLGPIYGFQWRHFGALYNGCGYNYKGHGIDQLQKVIDLIKNDPSSRRIILNSWNSKDIDKMALPPCHVMVQFHVDVEEGCLDAKLTQRSGDMFLGVPFNIASYSFLLHIIGNLTGYTPRYFIHDIGDGHIYENHREAIVKQLKRTSLDFPELKIKRKLESIDDIEESDFEILNYNHQGTIKADMIA